MAYPHGALHTHVPNMSEIHTAHAEGGAVALESLAFLDSAEGAQRMPAQEERRPYDTISAATASTSLAARSSAWRSLASRSSHKAISRSTFATMRCRSS